MILLDVNVLIAAFREDAPDHALARRLAQTLMGGSLPYGWNSFVLAAVVRITTHEGVFRPKNSAREALEFCEAFTSPMGATQVEPGRGFWRCFSKQVQGAEIEGPRISDALIAAVAEESHCTLVTWDRDFLQFDNLDVLSPPAALKRLQS